MATERCLRSLFSDSSDSKNRPLQIYLWGVIAYIGFVILWGAYVRATGSGAGCGSHWPLCNGQVLPLEPNLKTKIEFFHRITSGLSLPLVLGAAYWIYKIFPKGYWIRKTILWSSVSIIMEAVIGAGLVLFELVSQDQSLKRTVSISLHFTNTLILLGSLVLTNGSLRKEGKRGQCDSPQRRKEAYLATAVFFAIGITGAVTALGDTLFPAQSLMHGLSQDWEPGSHFLLRLRMIHPILASCFIFLSSAWISSQVNQSQFPSTKRLGKGLIALLFINFGIGIWNIASLAPIPLQLFHLGFGLVIWIVWVLFIDLL